MRPYEFRLPGHLARGARRRGVAHPPAVRLAGWLGFYLLVLGFCLVAAWFLGASIVYWMYAEVATR